MAEMLRVCTVDGCRTPAEDYQFKPGEYWCARHLALKTVGKKCMCCTRVLRSAEEFEGWYVDNAGQLCPEHNP